MPPFRKGLSPLFRAGLIEELSDPLAKFLWFCEELYLDNLLLRNALAKAGLDAEVVLKTKRPVGTTPGSRGPHRKVFDPLYEGIATDWLIRRDAEELKGCPSKQKPN